MVKRPSKEDLYLSAFADPACRRLLTTLFYEVKALRITEKLLGAYMYGYVSVVATAERSGRRLLSWSLDNYLPNLESAPSKKKSISVRVATAVAAPAARSLFVRLDIRKFFNCSNAVYWMIGLMTRTNAGPIPLQKALKVQERGYEEVGTIA